MKEGENFIEALKKNFSKIKKITQEISSLSENIEKMPNQDEKKFISSQINSLKISLREANERTLEILDKVYLAKPLKPEPQKVLLKKDLKEAASSGHKSSSKILKSLRREIPELERKTIKRLKERGEEIKLEKVRKASRYVWISNKVFSRFSMSIVNNKIFRNLKRDLIKANMQFIPANYISVIFFTTLLSLIGGFFVFLFFLFFNISPMLPIIIPINENLFGRLLKVFWILFAIPIGTFLLMYFYPWLEKKSIENLIDQELPFATIHMSAIAGSMIDPSKIFSIIISTKEYPELEKKFTKLINEVHVYGYDLASTIRNMAFFSPSTKLSELFNGIATTITSGGDLADFFDKRAKSLLFEHRIEREKQIRAAETFMDIYISVVIAAPMILMLLLIMMKVSGLGVSFSTTMITVIIVLTVSIVNVLFLSFLHMKQPKV
ncbi:MAG: type II secretion system F family protein [Nanoarchaeota archaeon]